LHVKGKSSVGLMSILAFTLFCSLFLVSNLPFDFDRAFPARIRDDNTISTLQSSSSPAIPKDVHLWGDMYIDESTRSIWVDGSGNMYMCGSIESNLMLMKWDPVGTLIWCHNASGIYGTGVCGDGMGAIYTSGTSAGRMILVKWDMDGNQIWNRTWTVSGREEGESLLVDENGSIYLFGSMNTKMALVKWDVDGTQIWNLTWGYGTYYDYASAIDQDGEGNIVGVGYSKRSSSDDIDISIVKWDPNG
jgi:hypothetical protein